MPARTSALSSTRGIAPRLPESNVVPIPAGEHGPSANDVLRRFNRDTAWLAVGLLSILVLAALALALLPPQPHRAIHSLAAPASQDKSTTSLTEDAAVLSLIVDSNSESSAIEVTSKTLAHVDQGATGSSSKESVARREAARSIPAPILLPEPTPNFAMANVDNRSHVQRKEAARAFRAKGPHRRSKSSYALTDADVKKRLIELWHQSLERTEKPQNWSTFSKLDRKKKAALIARNQP